MKSSVETGLNICTHAYTQTHICICIYVLSLPSNIRRLIIVSRRQLYYTDLFGKLKIPWKTA